VLGWRGAGRRETGVDRTGDRRFCEATEKECAMTATSDHTAPPSEIMLKMITGYWGSQAVGVAARLGVADLCWLPSSSS